MKDNRNVLSVSYGSLKRMTMWYYMKEILNLTLVSEFPKSGGTWLCQMISDAMDLPFPRNKSPKFEASIMHGHYHYDKRFGKMVCLVRDGRDVMVSAYYHFLFEHNLNPMRLVKKWRKIVPFKEYDNINENLPKFIECHFNYFTVLGKSSNWSDFVKSYIGKNDVYVVKYEDLLDRGVDTLLKVLLFLHDQPLNKSNIKRIVEEYSFKNMSKREVGEENIGQHLRKGISGDWKNKYTEEACEVFKYYGGEALILAGYEKDLDWQLR